MPELTTSELADQLCALIDDDGLHLEEAAARLGISRALARQLYAGGDVRC